MKVQKDEFQVNTEMTATLMIKKVKFFLKHNNLALLSGFFKQNIYRKESIWFCDKLQKYLVVNQKITSNVNYMNKLNYLLNLKIYKAERNLEYRLDLCIEDELKNIEKKLIRLILNPNPIKYEEF